MSAPKVNYKFFLFDRPMFRRPIQFGLMTGADICRVVERYASATSSGTYQSVAVYDHDSENITRSLTHLIGVSFDSLNGQSLGFVIADNKGQPIQSQSRYKGVTIYEHCWRGEPRTDDVRLDVLNLKVTNLEKGLTAYAKENPVGFWRILFGFVKSLEFESGI